MDPTIPVEPKPDIEGPSGDMSLSGKLELVAAGLTAVVGLEFLALIVGVSTGGQFDVADRIELISLNIDAKLAVILLIAAMLATLRDIVTADFQPPRSVLGRRTLVAVATLGVLIAVLSLIGVGLDISRSQIAAYGTNTAAAVIHRLGVVLMAVIPVGWALSALGIRITRTP